MRSPAVSRSRPSTSPKLPAGRALAGDPTFQGLLRQVGSDNTVTPLYFQTTLSRVSDRAGRDPQTNFHAATFHPTVKAWLFLVDVEEADGPFNYVPGSHRLTPARLEWERMKSLTAAKSPDAETRAGSFWIERDELRSLGLPDPVSFAVPANTLVGGDTFGFHARGAARGRYFEWRSSPPAVATRSCPTRVWILDRRDRSRTVGPS